MAILYDVVAQKMGVGNSQERARGLAVMADGGVVSGGGGSRSGAWSCPACSWHRCESNGRGGGPGEVRIDGNGVVLCACGGATMPVVASSGGADASWSEAWEARLWSGRA